VVGSPAKAITYPAKYTGAPAYRGAITLLAKALGDRGELLLISPGGEMARLLELTGMATYPNVRVLTEPEADHEAGELVHAKEDRPSRAT